MKNNFNKIIESWYIPFSGGVLFATGIMRIIPIPNAIMCIVLGITSLIYGFTKDRKKI